MDRNEIVVLEKPENVSWDEISSVLKQAHAENVKNGIVLPYPALPPEELYAKTEGRGGKLFVAMHNGKVVGTGAVAIIEKQFWCGKGKYAYCFFGAMLPNYEGKGVYRRIVETREKYAATQGVSRMMFDTDERNKRVIDIALKNGYKKVEYRVREGHNSVVLVKWLEGCPYSRFKCAIQFVRIKRHRKKAKK